ncbi:nucleolar MIF4G domain-containing protein 1 [Trichinella spiralis]|uniref:nucleolar MIF4G domain-containing protein 1 n=1 Tax=Trichinella spiralis TaxID=6334 RepID=UPI0001EFC272|nr:nucleolar MIF4G domain-containing protein 1 [Trichinella spiralis]
MLQWNDSSVQIKNTSEHGIVYEVDYKSTWVVYVVFGITDFIMNMLLTFLVVKDHTLKKMKKYLTGYAIGSALTGCAFAWLNLRLLLNYKNLTLITTLQCMVHNLDLTLLQIGESCISLCIFAMSVDRFVAIHWPRIVQTYGNKVSNGLWIFALVFVGIDTTASWLFSIRFSEPQYVVLSSCLYKFTVDKAYYIIHYSICALLGYITIALYAFVMLAVKKKRSESDHVRSIQLKREAVIMRRVLILVISTFFLQNLPETLHLIDIFTPWIRLLPEDIFLMKCISLSLYANIYMLTHRKVTNAIKRALSKCSYRNVAVTAASQFYLLRSMTFAYIRSSVEESPNFNLGLSSACIALGTLGIGSSVILIIVNIIVGERHADLVFISMLSYSNLLSSMANIMYNSKQISLLQSGEVAAVTVSKCLTTTPHISFFLFTQDMSLYSTIAMGVERMAQTTSQNFQPQFSSYYIIVYWNGALKQYDKFVSPFCSFRECFPENYYFILAVTQFSLQILAICIFCTIPVLLCFQRSGTIYVFTQNVTRMVISVPFHNQHPVERRERAITYSILVVIALNTVTHFIPWCFELFYMQAYSAPLRAMIRILQSTYPTLAAVIYLSIHPVLKQHTIKLFPFMKHFLVFTKRIAVHPQ